MNPDWLRYFVTVARTRNLHVAAEQLCVTPQALSKALGALEDQVGAVLIDRDRRIRGLTPIGEVLLAEAQDVLRALENAERRMAECRDGTPHGPVAIGGVGLWHHYLLPQVIAALRERYPELRPQVFEMPPNAAERRVAAGDVAIGLLPRQPRRSDLECKQALVSPHVIAGKPGRRGMWSDFAYIVPRIFGRELRASMDGWPQAEYPRRVAAEADQLETALCLAEAGVGAVFVPELAVRGRVARGTLAIVADAPFSHADQLYVVWQRGVRLTPAAQAVIDAIEG